MDVVEVKPHAVDESPPTSLTRQNTIEAVNKLSTEQRALLKTSFSGLNRRSIANGITMYLKMFQEHPDTKKLFPKFRYLNDEALMATNELRNQAEAYMHGMDTIINNLDSNEGLSTELKKIAKTHKKKGVEKSHVDKMLPLLLCVVKSADMLQYTPELTAAWTTLFEIIADMIEQYKREEKS